MYKDNLQILICTFEKIKLNKKFKFFKRMLYCTILS